MPPELLIYIEFASCLLIVAVVVWVNVRMVKRKVRTWYSTNVFLFMGTFGQFGAKQTEFWKRRAGYDEGDARIIVKYQWLCYLEIAVGVLTFLVLVHYFFQRST